MSPVRPSLRSLVWGLALLIGAIALAAATVGGPPAAGAADADVHSLFAGEASSRSCLDRRRSDSSSDSFELTAPADGYLSATLSAANGDWDLAIFNADSGLGLGGGASRESDELAQTYVFEGDRIVMQGCRRSGDASSADVRVGIERLDLSSEAAETVSLVRVKTRSDADKDLLAGLGLDLTESGGPRFIDVVVHDAGDHAAIERTGLRSEVLVKDLAAQQAESRKQDRAYAARANASALPSGRTDYRLLADYQQELKDLAADHPDIVRPITLNHETFEGRSVEGIEITTKPNKLDDGKPVFLQMGLHHAREWPSGEHAIEWAYELINGYTGGDPRVANLVESTRTIVIPVINPDGFNSSRTAGMRPGMEDGEGGDALTSYATSPGAYRRKNCRVPGTEQGSCPPGASAGLAETGVDPNRNYGGFWGGPGASDSPEAQDYRGPGPFSEPETQNVRELVSSRQVTGLITNHTFSNLVLRPPAIAATGDSVDEPAYAALGAAMSAQNGYENLKSFELYDTSGGTEDWTYYTTGGFGFTYEIGCDTRAASSGPTGAEGDCVGNFHPPYQSGVVDHYEGNNPEAPDGAGGNREAYFTMQEFVADAANHSLLTGSAPNGAELRITKTVQTPTWEGFTDGEVDNPGPPFFEDTLTSSYEVPSSGKIEWDINPSTRPLVAQPRGREALGEPSATQSFAGTPATATPCADFETDDPSCWNDHPFTIPDDGSDNDSATVAIQWGTPASDWDMKVFRDVDGDGTSEAETADDEVGQSAQGPTDSESTTFVSPETGDGRLQPGKYVVRVVNFAATEPYDGEVSFLGPQEFEPARTESWTLECFIGDQLRTTRQVQIDRGETQSLDLSGCANQSGGGGGGGGTGGGDGGSIPNTPASCKQPIANTIEGSDKGETIEGTKANDVIFGRDGKDTLSGLKGDDCLYGENDRDVVRGRGGDDFLVGGSGRDNLKGNAGDDKAKGGRSKDRIRTAGGADVINGQGGRDAINSGGGDDVLKGGKDRDRLRAGGGDDKLVGGDGDDILRGGGGKNQFKCGPGIDKVIAPGDDDKISKSCEKVKRR